MSFGLCNSPITFHRCMMLIFSDYLEKAMEVFMDNFLVHGHSFEDCISNLSNVIARCIGMVLVLNLEMYRFMVKEGIVLGHLISKKGIEVD